MQKSRPTLTVGNVFEQIETTLPERNNAHSGECIYLLLGVKPLLTTSLS